MLRLWLPEPALSRIERLDPWRGTTESILIAVMDTIGLISRCSARSRQRRHLRELDERLLADIGISPEAATREADRWL